MRFYWISRFGQSVRVFVNRCFCWNYHARVSGRKLLAKTISILQLVHWIGQSVQSAGILQSGVLHIHFVVHHFSNGFGTRFLSINIQLFTIFLSQFLFLQQLQGLDYNLCLLFMAVTSNVATISVYCYFGKMATESYKDMSYCLFESNWLYLPVELQKFFIMMIANAQIPLQYHAFHIVTLNLETLTKVSVGIELNC